MYEQITYEVLLKRMLAIAREHNPNIDTREGSMVWLGQAPSAVELRNLYIELEQVLNETFADTASREMLIKRAKERGLAPHEATRAVGKGVFTPTALELAIGTRFRLNELNYSIYAKTRVGEYQLQCEVAGEIGNEALGALIPVTYIEGLETAQLTEILIPGEDDESTEAFRKRYFHSLDARAFGGNVADYIEKANAISGVGGVKVYCEWNGGIKPASLMPPTSFVAWLTALTNVPAEIKTWLVATSTAAREGLLTVGGAVRLVVINSTLAKPTNELIDAVQSAIDPAENHAEGLGLAPIGHFVTVAGVSNTALRIAFSVQYQTGWSWNDVKSYAEQSIDAYFKELAAGWAESEALVVRTSQLEMRLLACPGVVDVTRTTINGTAGNLTLSADNIPVRGEVSG